MSKKARAKAKRLLDAMRDGSNDGMQHFDGEIEKLIRSGVIDLETGMTYATNAGNLRLELTDFIEKMPKAKAGHASTVQDLNSKSSASENLRLTKHSLGRMFAY